MADSIRAPLVKWAGGLLSRHGALTGDRNCCCCTPAFFVKRYEVGFVGLPPGPDPFPPFNSYYNGPGKNTCVFELAQVVENCESTAGERLYFFWIATCCPLDNYGNDENVFYADEITSAVHQKWIVELEGPSLRESSIYQIACEELTHDTWPSITDLGNPYPPYGEACQDGYYEEATAFGLTCEQLKQNRHCCEGFSTGF